MMNEEIGEYMEPASETVAIAEIIEVAVLKEYALRGETPPKAKRYEVEIDGRVETFHESEPEGEDLLERVNKKPCQWKLLQIVQGHEHVVGPETKVDLRHPGIECFRTEIRTEVTVFVEFDEDVREVTVPRGDVSVATIKQRADVPATYTIYAPRPGLPPGPVQDDGIVHVEGCEEFKTQLKTGGSS